MSNSFLSVDQAIQTLRLLKQAQPELFSQAIERITQPTPETGTQQQSASKLIEALLNSPFTVQNQLFFSDLISQLPQLEDGALAITIWTSHQTPSNALESLLARCVYLHGITHPWSHFLIQQMCSGHIPPDALAAREILWRLESIRTEPDSAPSLGLDDPAVFSHTLYLFFQIPLPWTDLCSQVGLDPLSWIVTHWLDSDPKTQALALHTLIALMLYSPPLPIEEALWIEITSRCSHLENAPLVFTIIDHLCPKIFMDSQSNPLCNLIKKVNPTPLLPQILQRLLDFRPTCAFLLDQGQFGPLYWINQRLSQPSSSSWQQPLLDAFDLLCQHGVPPTMILPQYNPISYSAHPHIQSRVQSYLDAQMLSQHTPAANFKPLKAQRQL